jgi:alkylhydroperoxidase family enzyme
MHQIHSIEATPGASRPGLEKARKTYSFISNLYGVFAESPAAVNAHAGIYDALSQSRLSEAEKHVVAIAASVDNGCHYCLAARSTVAARQDVLGPVIEGLRSESPLPDPKLEALRSLTLALIRKPVWLEASELHDFFAAGYDQGQVQDVLAILALKTLSNYTNQIAETPLDTVFEPQRWEKRTQRDWGAGSPSAPQASILRAAR